MNWSFEASWFLTRIFFHRNETYKISSTSRTKIVRKCIKIVSTDIRIYKILKEGECPLSCSTPTRAFGTRKGLCSFMAGPLFKSRRRPCHQQAASWFDSVFICLAYFTRCLFLLEENMVFIICAENLLQQIQ